MQMLHPWRGSIQQYEQEISDPDRYRPDYCPLCHARDPLRAHGFYCRTLVDVQYDGSVRVRRYLCLLCKRTVSLLPEFVLPYLRFTIQVISLFLLSRLLYRRTLREAAGAAFQPNMPYQRGQFWIRRFHQGIWRQWAPRAQGQAMKGGHFFPEENPDDTAVLVKQFLSA